MPMKSSARKKVRVHISTAKKYISGSGERLQFSPSIIKKICNQATGDGKRVLVMTMSESDMPLSDITRKKLPELIFVGLIVYALVYLFSEGSMFAFTFGKIYFKLKKR